MHRESFYGVTDERSSNQLIVAGGSPSTVIAVAEWCKVKGITVEHFREGKADIVFTQASGVGKGSDALTAIEADTERKIVVIGLPVNDRDLAMTTNFLHAVGEQRLTVYDEHDRVAWAGVQKTLGFESKVFNTPGKGEGHLSAGSLIAYVHPGAGIPSDWVGASDYLDNRNLIVSDDARKLAEQIDAALNVDIRNNKARVEAVLALLGDPQAKEGFEARVTEGKAIAEATRRALENAEFHGPVLVIKLASGEKINVGEATNNPRNPAIAFVVIVGEKAGEKGVVIQIGLNRNHTTLGKSNLIDDLKKVGVTAIGVPGRVTVYDLNQLHLVVKTLENIK